MVLNIFGLDDVVPETVMLSTTPDIGQFCDYGWYELVMFWDDSVIITEDRLFCVGC